MTEIQVRLPDRLHQKACEVSRMQHIPVDEIMAASLAQNLFRMIPHPYLEERANRATGEGFSAALSQIPDTPPEEYDNF